MMSSVLHVSLVLFNVLVVQSVDGKISEYCRQCCKVLHVKIEIFEDTDTRKMFLIVRLRHIHDVLLLTRILTTLRKKDFLFAVTQVKSIAQSVPADAFFSNSNMWTASHVTTINDVAVTFVHALHVFVSSKGTERMFDRTLWWRLGWKKKKSDLRQILMMTAKRRSSRNRVWSVSHAKTKSTSFEAILQQTCVNKAHA